MVQDTETTAILIVLCLHFCPHQALGLSLCPHSLLLLLHCFLDFPTLLPVNLHFLYYFLVVFTMCLLEIEISNAYLALKCCVGKFINQAHSLSICCPWDCFSPAYHLHMGVITQSRLQFTVCLLAKECM